MTTINYHNSKAIAKEDVKIAGNFNHWSPQPLTYNKENKNYEYHINTNQEKGKLIFKFVIDGVWQTNEDYSTEFDEAGNENNVLLFDNISINENTASKEAEDASKLEPPTPDPTPNGAPSNIQPTISEPIITEAPVPKQLKKSNIAASKAEDLTTRGYSSNDSSGTPKISSQQDPTRAKFETSTTSSSPPNPEPEARPVPSAATQTSQTAAKTKTQATDSVREPEPVKRPVPSGTDVADRGFESAQGNDSHAGSSNQQQVVSKDKGTSPAGFGLGFFAVILQAIHQFFRTWFTPGA